MVTPAENRSRAQAEAAHLFEHWDDEQVRVVLKAFQSRTRTRLYSLAMLELEKRGYKVEGTRATKRTEAEQTTYLEQKLDKIKYPPVPQLEMIEILSQGTKYDQGKTQLDLLSPSLLFGISEVLKYGAEKYAPYNWAKGIMFSRVFAALQRHLWDYWNGEDLDAETEMHHLWHAGCCLMFLIHYVHHGEQYKEFNDRPNYQTAASTRDASQELSGTRGLSGEDSKPTVTPESRDAHRVHRPIADRPQA